MRNNLQIIICLLFITQSLFGQIKEIAKKGINSTVAIIGFDEKDEPFKYGSGFILDSGKVVTNFHVIQDCKAVVVLTNQDTIKYYSNELINVDKINDIAIVKVDGLNLSALTLSTDTIFEIGDAIYAVGNPKGLQGTFSEGIISSFRNKDNRKLIQITAPISHGSSGGPVLNSKGEVIGISVSTLAEGQNLNFAVPVEYLSDIKNKKINTILMGSTKADVNNKAIVKETEFYPDKINIKSALEYYNLGCERFNNQEYNEAISYYDKSIEMDTKNYNAYFQRGYSKFRTEQFDESYKDYYNGIMLYEDYYNSKTTSPDSILNESDVLLWVRANQGYGWLAVIQILTELINKYPSRYDLYEVRGAYNYDIENYLKATDDYNVAVLKWKDQKSTASWLNQDGLTNIYINMAYAYSKLDSNVKAIYFFNKVFQAGNFPIENLCKYYFERGSCKFKLTDYRGAIEDADKALSFFAEGMALKNKTNYISMMSYDVKSFQLTDLYTLRGSSKLYLGQYQLAISDLNQAIKNYPKEFYNSNGKITIPLAIAYFYRGQAKYHLKNIDGACHDWSKAGELGEPTAYELIKEYCK